MLKADGMQYDIFPQTASCKCYFFDDLGKPSSDLSDDGCEPSHRRLNDFLRRRFLRQVRLSERKRRRQETLKHHTSISEYASEKELEVLRASVDFLVELCETLSPLRVKEGNFKNWSHLAIDFILASVESLSSMGKKEDVERIVSSLIMRLLRRMCHGSQADGTESYQDQNQNHIQFYVQHLMRKLGSNSYIGQCMIFSVSERISMVAESLLFMDPFDDSFPKMHNCMYIMIQLVEFLTSDYLISWSAREDFDLRLFEEWVTSIFQARKGLELLENRNSLYMLYMDRVVGDLTKKLGHVAFLQKLRPEILSILFG